MINGSSFVGTNAAVIPSLAHHMFGHMMLHSSCWMLADCPSIVQSGGSIYGVFDGSKTSIRDSNFSAYQSQVLPLSVK